MSRVEHDAWRRAARHPARAFVEPGRGGARRPVAHFVHLVEHELVEPFTAHPADLVQVVVATIAGCGRDADHASLRQLAARFGDGPVGRGVVGIVHEQRDAVRAEQVHAQRVLLRVRREARELRRDAIARDAQRQQRCDRGQRVLHIEAGAPAQREGQAARLDDRDAVVPVRQDQHAVLRVHAAQFSGAVIDIEVRGELCMLRLDRQRSGVAAERGRQIALFGRRFRTRREMLRHVCA